MKRRALRVGEIVQMKPTVKTYGGCFATVTEPKAFGAQGYIVNAGAEGRIYIRMRFEDIEPTGGQAEWADIENYQRPASATVTDLVDTLSLAQSALNLLTSNIDIKLGREQSKAVHSAIDQIATVLSRV